MEETSFELQIPEPLAALIAASETICVAECCGVDAYDRTPDAIAVWIRKEGVSVARQAMEQARTLAEDVERHEGHVSSYPLLNLNWESGPTASYLREWAFNIERAIDKVEPEKGTAA